jgi:hypothetical protein
MTENLTKLTGAARFENRILTAGEIQQIAQSTGLRGISFINCAIADEDVLQFCKLSKLVNVLLENTAITDKSLEYLSGLANLKYLFITKANITGAGFRHFEHNKKIECIWACSTQLNDEHLKLLSKIPKLATLVINDTLVTFEGLLAIAGNPNIHIVANDIFTKDQIALFEQEQRTLASKNGPKDAKDIQHAKDRLMAFFDAMTEWEKYANEVGFTEELGTRCKNVFNMYCTEKPRPGYRPEGLHYSGGPGYTYGEEKLLDSEQVSKNKIIFYTKNHIDFKYRYILVKKNNEWRIDERQYQSGGWKKEGL